MTTNYPFDQMARTNLPHGTLRCGICDAVGYAHERFCACCGTAFQGRCNHCGSEITHSVAYFCTECGRPLDEHVHTRSD